MTVSKINDDGTIDCIWFDSAGHIRNHTFQVALLMEITADP